jgi:hypothetical protein
VCGGLRGSCGFRLVGGQVEEGAEGGVEEGVEGEAGEAAKGAAGGEAEGATGETLGSGCLTMEAHIYRAEAHQQD